jgi:hypothetical protein
MGSRDKRPAVLFVTVGGRVVLPGARFLASKGSRDSGAAPVLDKAVLVVVLVVVVVVVLEVGSPAVGVMLGLVPVVGVVLKAGSNTTPLPIPAPPLAASPAGAAVADGGGKQSPGTAPIIASPVLQEDASVMSETRECEPPVASRPAASGARQACRSSEGVSSCDGVRG